jgi:hypothetical protein
MLASVSHYIIVNSSFHRVIVVIRSRGFAAITPGYRALAPTGLLKEVVYYYYPALRAPLLKEGEWSFDRFFFV